MSKHNHAHTGCEHGLKYCCHCDVVYCTKCSKEWGNTTYNILDNWKRNIQPVPFFPPYKVGDVPRTTWITSGDSSGNIGEGHKHS